MSVITKNIEEAIAVLKDGGVVVFPTGTTYGIGCDATNSDAIKRVKIIKKRSDEVPLLAIVLDMSMAEEYGVFSKTAKKLAKKHWPGPLTVVVPQVSGKLPKNISNNKTVGLRVSSSKIVKQLVQAIGVPLVATSANIHGKPPPYKIKDSIAQFSEAGLEPDLYLDGGKLKETQPSMVIEVVDSEVIIHRQGAFKL